MPRKPTGPKLKTNHQGYFEIHWTEAGRSKRVSTGTADLQEAQSVLAGWLYEKSRDPSRPASIKTLLEAYLREHIGNKSPRTSGVITNKLVPAFGHLPVNALTADAMQTYVADRAKGGKGACSGTIRREVGVLIAAVNHAKRQLRVDPSVIPYIALPDGSPPRKQTFSEAQLDQLIEIVAPAAFEKCSRICRFFWLAMETASRRRAIETLTWKNQVDTQRRIIAFDDDGSDTIRKIKRRAKVPISDRLLPMLERFYDERESNFVLGDDGEIYQAWKALMRRAARLTGDGTFTDMVPHDLRRTWATHAAQQGVSIWDIAGILGDTPASVTKSYAHHSPDFLRNAANFRSAPPEKIRA